MKLKQTIKLALGAAFIVASALFTTITLPPATIAAECTPGESNCCGGVQTSLISCEQTGGDSGDIENTGIWGVLLIAINILTAGVGVAAIGGIIYGAILYTSAGGSQEQVKKAMGIFTNVVIGVLAYALMYAGLNFLIPGGLFT